ncbi:unnamed protein product [Cuscuta campestris]|uniref:Dihydroflavonol 4-reductase n=1 Tax=Cuscuta campestris TaxID=132261 RepID=A0A484LBN8_9ASTE|nr:unnamed protein product [Cuscuta campestris]
MEMGEGRDEERAAEYCVTGGTGLVGANLVKALLDKGYRVRTTVRDPENAEKVGFLWDLNERASREGRLKIVKADLMEEGSFDDAVEGVDGVFHTASPVLVPKDRDIRETLIDPCVKGTLNVLRSCRRAAVKRVVLTSSCSSIRYRHDATHVSPLNESHWTDLDYCKRYNLWYPYAKTVAEQEAWKWAGEESGTELVVVNPSFVVGPLLTPRPTSTLRLLLGIVKGMVGEYPNKTVGFVHVEDAVRAHLLAMETPRASGCRLICSTTVAHFSQIIHMLRAKYPSYPYESKCSNEEGDDGPHSLDCTKIMELGFSPPFISLPQMLDDFILSFRQKGFLSDPLNG